MNVRIPRFITLARRVALLALLPLCAVAGTARIESGHSAMWIDPSRNGEGWILEILPNDTAALYWYTSDDAGKPRWIISHAPIVHGEDGDKIIYNELVTGHGGRFGPEYDPDEVTLENVGSAEFSFTDCNNGQISFNAYGKAGTYPLTRLSRTMAAGCAPVHGIPGEPVQPYAGTSGTWFDPDKPGQAFTLQWLANGGAILFWFAYDAEGHPFWMAGAGQYEDGRVVFEQLDSVQGGQFGGEYPPEQATLVPWGRLELEITCEGGTATYEATAEGFGSGSFDLVPLTRLAKPACPWVKPKLTDLYDVTLIELPQEPATPPPDGGLGSSNIILPGSVANNGSVAATRKMVSSSSLWHVPVRLTLDEMIWKDLPLNQVEKNPIISAQGDAVLVTDRTGAARRPTILEAGEAQALPISMYPASALGASDDLSRAVGYCYRNDRPDVPGASNVLSPWLWDAEQGYIELPTTEELATPYALRASNDGRRVVGRHDLVTREIPGWDDGAADLNGNLGLYWQDGQEPQLIRGVNGEYFGSPVACDANCDIVFGTVSWQSREPWFFPNMDRYIDVLRGQSDHSWYWRPGIGQSGSLCALNPTEGRPAGWAYSLFDVSGDGGLAVGSYRSPEMTGGLPSGTHAYDGLIWSQNTGFVLLFDLLEEAGQSLDWPAVYAHDISPDGKYILLTTAEIFTAPGQTGMPSFAKMALLRLIPKASEGAIHQP